MQPAFAPTFSSVLVDPMGLVRCVCVVGAANSALVSKSKKDGKPDPRSGG